MFDNIVAKEGKQKILLAFTAFIFFVIFEFSYLSFLSFVILISLLYIYRYKNINSYLLNKNNIYAPISGQITAIDTNESEKIIYINVSLFDNHILRALENGSGNFSIRRGVNILLSSLKSKKLNEQAFMKFENSSMQLISSIFNESINIEKKDDYKKGEKIGTFLHGEVIVYVKKDYDLNIEMGQKVYSGVTILVSN